MNTRIPRLPIVATLLGLTTGLLPTRLLAMQTSSPEPSTSVILPPGIPASDGELSAAIRAQVSRGDALTGMRRYAAAQREYLSATMMVRRQGHLPSYTLWHLASAYYYEGDLRRAAAVLEHLAIEAGPRGDLAVEALALFNAAWLNGESGRRLAASTQIADLSTLLRSPYMPAAVREHLIVRLVSNPVAIER